MKRKRKARKKIGAGFNVSPSHASQGRLFGQTGAYLMGSVFHPYKNKWGISDRTDLRRAQVDKDVTGDVYTIFGRQIFYGWFCEQFVHFIYQLQRAPMKNGSGRMEWYRTFNPIFGSLFLWFTWDFDFAGAEWYWKPIAQFNAYLSPFIWIDGLLWLVFFRLLGWAFCAGLVVFLLWFWSH